MNPLKPRLFAMARYGLLVTLLALGASLVISAWANRRSAQQISALLDRGQAERFFRPIPPLHERRRGAANSQDLNELLEQFRQEGLRYLVEYDAEGELLAEAGEHLGVERPLPTGANAQPRVVGERVRVTFRPPRHDARLPSIVLEFEPVVANQLREHASRNFVFSVTTAVCLLALTLGLWLALQREERRRERTERERHLAALGEMSAVLAHEIRNPLASLKGHAQLLAEQLDAAAPQQKKVSRIVSEAERLEVLSNTLLDLVRSAEVTRADASVAELLQQAAEAVAAARIDVLATTAPKSWSLDALRVAQVLRNLLENALQASSPDGRVEISARQERGQLVIQVRDHGAGLPAGQEHQIFEPFKTTRTQGTGLGLAVARRIAELHGGRLSGANHPDGGALFTLTLPA